MESGEASVAGAAIAVAAHRASSELVIAAAKIRAGEAAAIAHQVHGAFGFTHKHRLLRLTRRSWSWRDEFGTESRWSRELGRREVHVQGEPPKVIRCSDLVNCHRNPPHLWYVLPQMSLPKSQSFRSRPSSWWRFETEAEVPRVQRRW